jgi:SpoVK/Ycf46/Vps4 family AAA+-type ATPase
MEEQTLFNNFTESDDSVIQMIGYNYQYLANNNFYQYKLDEIEKEKKELYRENCKLAENLENSRDDYRYILKKYKKLLPKPEAYNNKRKAPDMVQPSKMKKRRRSKYSLKEDKIKEIFHNIKNITDIIKLEEHGTTILHDPKLVKLYNIIPPLKKLDYMVGMENIKHQIFDHILYFIQGLNTDEMYHTVISGPPGVGKTELGKILGSIYLGLGILKKDTFRVVKRSELVGKYLGHTAAQTQEIIDECQGGVMFIDEAYSLGNEEKRDSFSKECLDTLNQNLTENKGNFMCIIAGYKDALNKCFFSYNEGLKRRFPFWYHIHGYDEHELKEIFVRKVKLSGWSIDHEVKSDFFKDKFKFYGGDIETFTFYSRMAYSKRIFNDSERDTKILTLTDLENGFKKFEDSKEKLIEKGSPPPFGMYV